MTRNNKKVTMRRKIRDSPNEIDEHYGELEYRGRKVLQPWRDLDGN